MIHYFNEITAAIAVPTLLWGFRGFWPHMIRMLRTRDFGSQAMGWLIAMVMIVDMKGIFRMAYWDLYRSAVTGGVSSTSGAVVNGVLNLMAFAAGLCALAALYYAIPEEDRDGWNWFTAPNYPTPLFPWRVFRRNF